MVSKSSPEPGVRPGSTLLGRAAELEESGRPFVLATVVWRRGPSSGKPGSRAIIHPDGTTEGWLGGACAHPTVVRAALSSLESGRPALLLLGEHDDRPGVTAVAMACTSEGAMEVHVEPILPKPELWVVGDSPAAMTLVRLAGVLGWRARTAEETQLTGAGERSFIVVATQGHNDETALERALSTRASYIGLVASEKRASSVLAWLRERGIGEESLVRVRAPAGLDLGSTEHEEIAVAILAELVSYKATGAGAQVTEVIELETAIDPVCGMQVDVASANWVSNHDGIDYYFCAPGCKKAFDADPASFLT